MKKLLAVICGVLISGAISFAATLTFEDLPVTLGNPLPIPQGYGGLNWDNMWVVKQDPSWAGAGLGDALAPGANAADNGYWYYGTIRAPSGQTFILNSAYMASCWWFPETLEVKGYLMGKLMYTRTYELPPSPLTLVEFPAEIIDSATFTPWATPSGPGTDPIIAQFLMDSLTINTPEKTAPWKGEGVGVLAPVTLTGGQTGYKFIELGINTPLGIFAETGTPDPATGTDWITFTAVNGDKLYGVVVETSDTFPVVESEVVIYDGTGRFQGATGSFVSTATIDPATLLFIEKSKGNISPPCLNNR